MTAMQLPGLALVSQSLLTAGRRLLFETIIHEVPIVGLQDGTQGWAFMEKTRPTRPPNWGQLPPNLGVSDPVNKAAFKGYRMFPLVQAILGSVDTCYSCCFAKGLSHATGGSC